MNSIVTLLVLVAAAYAVSFVLSQKSRRSYGLVSGAEFLAIGIVVGPSGLGFLSEALLEAAAPAMAAAAGWLGLRLGLRLLQTARCLGHEALLLLIEPLVSAGCIFGLVYGANALLGLSLSTPVCWALAAVGAPSTRSGVLWVLDRGARGPLTTRLQGLTQIDDTVSVLLLGALFAAMPLSGNGLGAWEKLGATVALGLTLAGMATVLIGRERLRSAIAWLALLGLSALGTGLSLRLGISSVAVAALFGSGLGATCRHASEVEALTEATERPLIQVLLVLLAAQLSFDTRLVFVAVLIAALRMAAKLLGGSVLHLLRRDSGADPWMGAATLSCGGLTTAMVLSLGQALGADAQLLLWAFVACSLLGDLLGSRMLVALLRRKGELAINGAGQSSRTMEG